MFMSWIQADQTWLLWAILLVISAGSMYLEKQFSWAQKISGAIIALVGAVSLTNLKIIPMESPVYNIVWEYVIPLSIPMLLFKSNLKKIYSESGRMMGIFILSALGSVIGALVGFFLLHDYIPHLDQITGMMTGSYIGGGINFVALSQVFEIPKPLISATTVADNFNMAIYFMMLMAIPKISWFLTHFKQGQDLESGTKDQSDNTDQDLSQITAYDLSLIFAIATSIVAVSDILATYFSQVIPQSNFLLSLLNQLLGNLYLIITTLTMVLATVFHEFFDKIQGAKAVGNFLIYIFFVVIGAPASISLIITTAPLLLVFCFIMVVMNMVVSFISAKVFGFTLEETIIASNAAIGGPATASVMAISQGWTDLIGPGIFVGLFGYILGNYLGTIIGNLLMTL